MADSVIPSSKKIVGADEFGVVPDGESFIEGAIIRDGNGVRWRALAGGRRFVRLALPSIDEGDAGKVLTVNDAETGFKLAAGASGASGAEFRVRCGLSGAPFSGGASGSVVLADGAGATDSNVVVFTTPPFVYAANHAFQITVTPPTFSAGTLTLAYGELDVTSPDGTQALGIGTAGIALISGMPEAPLTLNDGPEFTQVGSDLSQVGQTIKTSAGGVFVVSFYAKFAAVGLVA